MQDVGQYKGTKTTPTFKFTMFYTVENPQPFPSA